MYGKRKAFQPEGALCPLVLEGNFVPLEGALNSTVSPKVGLTFGDFLFIAAAKYFFLWLLQRGFSRFSCIFVELQETLPYESFLAGPHQRATQYPCRP